MRIKNLILLFFLCATISLFAQNEPKNYIEGKFEVKLNVTGDDYDYTLTEVTSKGIKFKSQGYYLGKEEHDGFVKLTFSDANIPCSGAMDFYKQDETGRWQRDSEVKAGTASFSSTKSMVVMLVLDCSNSLGADFSKIKDYAKQFISTLGTQSGHVGNIHVGVVGFSGMKQTFVKKPIPLNSLARVEELNAYINNLRQGPQTALYYAMHKGLDAIEEHVSLAKNAYSNFNFNGAFLVTFTDGLDNASRDPKIGVPANGENNPYYKYVKNIISTKQIQNKYVNSYMVALQGQDVSDINTFTIPLKKLASNDNQFFLAKHGQFDAVQEAFKRIASNLVQQWIDLNCYINPAFNGKCRWVLRCNDEPEPEPEPTPAPKVTSKPYKKSLGIVAGNLLGLSYKYVSPYKKFAYQMDLGGRYIHGDDNEFNNNDFESYFYAWSLEMNHNFLFQGHIKRWDDYCLDVFLGGGFSFGGVFGGYDYTYDKYEYNELGHYKNLGIKAGLNAMLGMEFMFERIPLTLQLDFRPGYGLYCNFETGNLYPAFFDYAIAASVRYTW